MINYEPAVDYMIDAAVRRLKDCARAGMLLPVDRFMQYFAFDVIARLTYDEDFGMLERMGDYKGIIGIIEKLVAFGPMLGTIPEFGVRFIRLARKLSGRSPTADLTAWSREAILSARQKEMKPKMNAKAEPFITKCLKLEAEGKIGSDSVMDSCAANISAGSDTTGSSLTTIMYYLYSNPKTLIRLRNEIDTAVQDGKLSNPISFHEAEVNLPYLKAVIKEGLRISPAVGHIMPRLVPPGGANLAGFYFPEGTEVACSPRVLHLNKRYHGEDCTEWRPERWLESQKLENDAAARIGSHFSFGGGTRVCLGKNISLLEMTKFVPEVVRRFDFEFDRSAETGDIVPPIVKTAFFRWMRYNCRIRDRST